MRFGVTYDSLAGRQLKPFVDDLNLHRLLSLIGR
jgi:hypothetical protein